MMRLTDYPELQKALMPDAVAAYGGGGGMAGGGAGLPPGPGRMPRPAMGVMTPPPSGGIVAPPVTRPLPMSPAPVANPFQPKPIAVGGPAADILSRVRSRFPRLGAGGPAPRPLGLNPGAVVSPQPALDAASALFASAYGV